MSTYSDSYIRVPGCSKWSQGLPRSWGTYRTYRSFRRKIQDDLHAGYPFRNSSPSTSQVPHVTQGYVATANISLPSSVSLSATVVKDLLLESARGWLQSYCKGSDTDDSDPEGGAQSFEQVSWASLLRMLKNGVSAICKKGASHVPFVLCLSVAVCVCVR